MQAETQTPGGSSFSPKQGALPGLAVLSSLFPSSTQPTVGTFIRERMFRLLDFKPRVVVSPQPWFPLQGLIRHFRPGYRPELPRSEVQQGVTVLFPRFLAFPGFLRHLDGLSMALCTALLMRRLKREHDLGILDAHFAYPCGYAAVLMGRWLGLCVTITLRGTETRHLRTPGLRELAVKAVCSATQVFSVSDSLRQLFMKEGVAGDRIRVVGNGVDLGKFKRVPRAEARAALGIALDAPVLISVGGLVERKGFHRVIDLLPALVGRFPGLMYLVVGGPSPEGDIGAQLRDQVRRLGMDEHVVFTGPLLPGQLSVPLSAADVFVLATSNEGWANVFLEAMACGLPVVATDVGGNAEVIEAAHLGRIVPFGDAAALQAALAESLLIDWDRERIVEHAQANTWDRRIAVLEDCFRGMAAQALRSGA